MGKPFYPKRNEVKKLARESPKSVFFDEDGRLYGFIDENNPVFKDLWDRGIIDNKKFFLLWIYLPQRAKNPNGKSKKITDISVDETLDFPLDTSEKIKVYRYLDKIYLFTFSLLYYTERTSGRDGRSNSMLVQTFS